jgi:hypothetical protein
VQQTIEGHSPSEGRQMLRNEDPPLVVCAPSHTLSYDVPTPCQPSRWSLLVSTPFNLVAINITTYRQTKPLVPVPRRESTRARVYLAMYCIEINFFLPILTFFSCLLPSFPSPLVLQSIVSHSTT